MMRRYETPKIEEVCIDVCILAQGGSATNGSGKRPPGWDKPNNPHKSKDYIFEANPFEPSPLSE